MYGETHRLLIREEKDGKKEVLVQRRILRYM